MRSLFAHPFPRPPSARRTVAEALEPRTFFSVSLVKDLNTLPFDAADPSQPVSLGAVALFANHRPQSSVELWRTDGTAAGTFELKDLVPGPQGSSPRSFVTTNNLAYFIAGTGPSAPLPPGAADPELWRSDGTASGTVRLAGGVARILAAVNGRAYFTAADPANGSELWTTDGTAAGSHLVRDITPGTGSTTFARSGTANGRLLFQTSARPNDLYATDGTDDGTVFLGSVAIRAANTGQQAFFPAGAVTYFVDTGGSLWKTDGTPAGTAKVLDAALGGSFGHAAGADDGTVFFNIAPPQALARLYRYHPAAGLTQVTDPGGAALTPRGSLVVVGHTLYFGGTVSSPATQTLYRLAPGAASASPVQGLSPFTGSFTNWTDFTRSGGDLFFRAGGGVWKVADADSPFAVGSRAGVVPTESDAGKAPRGLTGVGGVVVSAAYDRAPGWALYRADVPSPGAPLSPWLITDLSPVTHDAYPMHLTPWPFVGKALFGATEGPTGFDPYVTDGTAAGTVKLVDFSTHGATPHSFTPVGGTAWFIAPNGPEGTELWRTDGTPAGTARVAILSRFYYAMADGLTPSPRPNESGVIYFAAAGDNGAGVELWRSDGTAAGTAMVTDIRAGDRDSAPRDFVPLPDGTLLFTADDGIRGRELWQTDGTAAGTRLFKNITPDDDASPRSGPAHLTRIGNFVYFTADDGAHGTEPWRTDGTPAGTAMLADINPGRLGSDVANYADDDTAFAAFKGHVYFEAFGGLWRTDGTAAGTEPLANPAAGGIVGPSHFRLVGDRLTFLAGVPTSQVWTTDGTPQGTVPLVPGDTFSIVKDPTVSNEKLYFRAYAGGAAQLYTSDGTPQGTFMMDDLGGNLPGTDVVGPLAPLGDGSVLAGGNDGVVGVELFRFGNPWLPKVVARHVFYNDSAFDGRDENPNAADDSAIAKDKQPLLPGQLASFSNITTYTRGLNGIMFDVSGGLPLTLLVGIAGSAQLQTGTTGDPSTWADAPRPSRIAVRPGAGALGSDRITLTWSDGAIRNAWLRVTVSAPPQYDFPADTFTFGNLVGEIGAPALTPASWTVTSADANSTRTASSRRPALINAAADHNRDGLVNVLDYTAARANMGTFLARPTSAPAPPPPAAAVRTRVATRPDRRSILDEANSAILRT